MINYSIREKTVKGNKYYVMFFRIPMSDGSLKPKEISLGTVSAVGGIRKAKEKAKERIAEYEGLVYSDRTDMLLGDFVADWIERHKAVIQPTTFECYSHMNRRHIQPYFAERNLRIRDIKPLHLQQYVNAKMEEVSQNTVIKHLTLLKSAMQDAVVNDIIKSNPAYKIQTPKKIKPVHNYYTPNEIDTLLSAVKGTAIEVPVFIAVLFGLRRGEILGLRWSDIDLENKTLTVNGAVKRYHVDGKWVDTYSTELKTEASYSTYLLNDSACRYFKDLYDHNMKLISDVDDYKTFVCVNEIGERLRLDFVTSKFRKILKQNNLKHIRFHDLRHSTLTLLSQNYQMKAVQAYARHSNYSITADTYAHTDNSATLAQLNTICAALGITE